MRNRKLGVGKWMDRTERNLHTYCRDSYNNGERKKFTDRHSKNRV